MILHMIKLILIISIIANVFSFVWFVLTIKDATHLVQILLISFFTCVSGLSISTQYLSKYNFKITKIK